MHADRQICRGKTAANADRGQAGDVERNRIASEEIAGPILQTDFFAVGFDVPPIAILDG